MEMMTGCFAFLVRLATPTSFFVDDTLGGASVARIEEELKLPYIASEEI